MSDKELTFEEKLQRLEDISEKIQDNKISIEQVAEMYNESINLYKDCKKYLDDKKIEITVLNQEKES